MNKPLTIAVAAFLAGGITSGVIVAQAQQAGPPPMPGGMHPGHEWPGMMGGGWPMGPHGPFGEHMRERMEQRAEMMKALALVATPDDRKLSPADVTKIAEGFLLWKGNHTWKVMNAAVEADKVGFDLATKDGSVIAHFTMDPKTGALKRAS